jgi:hypothetical protein
LKFSCSIFTEERLERLTKDIGILNFESPEDCRKEENFEESIDENLDGVSPNHRVAEDMLNGTAEISELSLRESKPERDSDDGSHEERQMLDGDLFLLKKGVNDNVVPVDPDSEMVTVKRESSAANSEDCDINADDCSTNKQVVEKRVPNAVLPLLRQCQYESSESSSR